MYSVGKFGWFKTMDQRFSRNHYSDTTPKDLAYGIMYGFISNKKEDMIEQKILKENYSVKKGAQEYLKLYKDYLDSAD